MAYQHHHDMTDTIINSITHALINGGGLQADVQP